MAERVHALRDAQLIARVVRCVPMRYRAGADRSLDRPAHVRAASGLAWVGERLAVVQDDAGFVALVDPATGEAESIALPAGRGGARQFDASRGNKSEKLDLEAVTIAPGRDGPLLVAIGSGSSARREIITLIDAIGTSEATVAVHRLPQFFAALREAVHFAGSELNVEGLLYAGGWLRLFGRGNGAARGELMPENATCDVSWHELLAHMERPDLALHPPPGRVVQFDLGSVAGVRLSFTDAVLASTDDDDGETTLYTAAAEASPDAIGDGPVAGSAIGVIVSGSESRGGGPFARWTELLGVDGRRLEAKVEGIALLPGERGRAYVAIDRDQHDLPSELCEVALRGGWLDRESLRRS